MLATAFPGLGIGFAGVALAFGLTVLTIAYAIGHISGCHLNPAVSVGLVVGKRFPASELPAHAIAQVLGGIAGADVLYFIAVRKDSAWPADLLPTATASIPPAVMPWARAWRPRWC